MFKAKHNLPVLSDYSKGAPAAFWEAFPSNYVEPGRSLINPNILRRLGLESNFPDLQLLNTICLDVSMGADIACRGDYRLPSRATNAPSAFLEGEKVTDAVADWVAKGFAFGPVPVSSVPANAKFSGLMARPKPNGGARVILNLSAPKGRSVNEGIDTSHLPTVMSSTGQWLSVLNKAGRGCFLTKVDWADAYKHLPVRLEDSHLQWFTWLDKAFKENCLVFGGASSAGLFDRLAKLVLHIVIYQSSFDRGMVVQHLDDVCAAHNDYQTLMSFDLSYQRVASELGVCLAPRDDPQKSFGPSTSGIVLGIHYDTVEWTWAVPPEKLLRLLHDVRQALLNDTIRQDLMWKIVGKILHVRPLIPDGRFHLFHLLKANALSDDPGHLLALDSRCRAQLWFWFTLLQTCSGRVSIPDPDLALPAWALDVYTDAAGGSPAGDGRGAGAVCSAWWTQVPWGHAINCGRLSVDGRRLDAALSVLELFGPLWALVMAAPLLQGRDVRFWVDNAAAVFIWNKGYSTSCSLSAVLVATLAEVASFLGCRVELHKITRCSTPLAAMADALSKGSFSRFRALADQAAISPRFLDGPPSPSLLAWVSDPSPDWDLGLALVAELQGAGLGLRASF